MTLHLIGHDPTTVTPQPAGIASVWHASLDRMERAGGVEPPYSVWKTEALTVVLRPLVVGARNCPDGAVPTELLPPVKPP